VFISLLWHTRRAGVVGSFRGCHYVVHLVGHIGARTGVHVRMCVCVRARVWITVGVHARVRDRVRAPVRPSVQTSRLGMWHPTPKMRRGVRASLSRVHRRARNVPQSTLVGDG
jgi:hypothetical protein